MKRAYLIACMLVLVASEARAHFALRAPPAYSVQDGDGMPEKSAPCGQADPGIPVVPTHVVTSFHSGDTITVSIDERIFHPGHYRVALAADQSSLPVDPTVTADASSPCGSAQIQTSATPGVLVDNMLSHTAPFTAPQSFQVTLPAGMTCTSCTLQVVEFMSDHPLNNPGGCFYHHCAQISIVPQGTPLPDAGVGTGTPGSSSGGCDTGYGGGGLAMLAALGLIAWPRRLRRRAVESPGDLVPFVSQHEAARRTAFGRAAALWWRRRPPTPLDEAVGVRRLILTEGTKMMKSTVLLVIALAAGTAGYAQADDAKQPPAAKEAPKDAAKDTPKDASGASAEVKAGTGVEKHEIVGEAQSFPAGTTVWVWSRITGGEGNIKHVWKQDGKEVWTATLPIGSKLWTTMSRRTIPAAGSWQVDVQTEAGAQLGTVSFTIQ